MSSVSQNKRDSLSSISFKKFGNLLARAFSVDSEAAVTSEARSRTLSLPDFAEEDEFWNLDDQQQSPLYENTRGLDCTSLFNYNLEEENIYDDPSSYRTRGRVKSAENSSEEEEDQFVFVDSTVDHTYEDIRTFKNNTNKGAIFYCANLRLPEPDNPETEGLQYEELTASPQQYDKLVHSKTDNQISETYSENLNLKPDHQVVEESYIAGPIYSEVDKETNYAANVLLSNDCAKSEVESSTKKVESTDTEQNNPTVCKSVPEKPIRTTSIRVEHSAVSELKQRFEKQSTREQIIYRYCGKSRRISVNKNKMNNGNAVTPKSVKDMRSIFEKGNSEVKVTSPTSTPKSSRPTSGIPIASRPPSGISIASRPTSGIASRPLSAVSVSSSVTDRLDPKRGSVASSMASDLSSDEDEAHLVPQIEPDSDAEEERDEEVEEEMQKRKEESPEEKNRRKRFKIAEELYTTEEAYYQTLVLIHVNFRKRLQSEDGSYYFSESTIREMFMNTEQLHDLHKHLRDKLKDRIENWKMRPRVGDIMKDIAPYFQLYTDYMAKFENAIKSLNEMCSKNEKFHNIIQTMEADPVCKNLKISQHMLGPVQRIPRYRMLLEDYIRHLEENSPDYPDVKKSLDQVRLAANKANDNITKLENFQLVSQLLRSVTGLGALEDLSSAQSSTPVVYIKHGHIKKMSRRKQQNRFLFLFSDVLLICKIEGHGKYKCNKKIHVSDLRNVQESDDPNMPFPFEVITKKCSFMLGAKDQADKTEWMASLHRVLKGHEAASATSPQRLGLVAPVWIPDNGVTMCMGCERTFTAILRRHHCRACGKVYCHLCSSNKVFLSFDNKIGRACDTCFNILHSRDFHDEETRKKRGLTVSSFFSGDPLNGGHQDESSDPGEITRGQLQSGDISGYLMVRFKDKDHYQRYWCVVRETILYFYAGTYDKKHKRSIPLLGWTIALPDESDKIESSGIILKVGHHNVDPFYLKFGAESEKEHWYETLSKAAILS